MKALITALAISVAPIAAGAATLTFDGAICNGGDTCSDGRKIDQTYGDIAGEVDVVYDSDRSTAAKENVFFWNQNYESLSNVIYGTNGGGGLSVALMAATGFDVLLSGFDIAPYANRSRNTLVQIIDLANNAVLLDEAFAPLSIDGVTSFAGSWESTVGLQINLGPDAWDVGMDNIAFRAVEETTTAPVPLPATGLLMLGGLFGVSRLRRKT